MFSGCLDSWGGGSLKTGNALTMRFQAASKSLPALSVKHLLLRISQQEPAAEQSEQ
jgi:hypothetical protein